MNDVSGIKLLMDIGNSRIKWAAQKDSKFISKGSCDYNDNEERNTLFLQLISLSVPDSIYASCVVSKHFKEELNEWVIATWGKTIQYVTPEKSACGVVNAYSIPEKLGADRWLAIIAAYNKIKSAAIVIDCGTAITIDAIDSKGVHKGGVIQPGLMLMLRSLTKSTAIDAISSVSLQHADISIFQKNTQDAIVCGVLQTAVASINQFISQANSLEKNDNVVFICGGDAATLLPLLATEVRHEPDLVLQGLQILTE